MTSTVITDEISGARRVEVRCDTCGKDAPPAVEIIAAHGLVSLGWYCSGGVHICADCPLPEMEGPQ